MAKPRRVATLADTLLSVLRDDYILQLEARNCSAKTVDTYLEALDGLRGYLVGQGQDEVAVGSVTRQDIEGFIRYLLIDRGQKPNTADNRRRGLHSFFAFCVAEGYIPTSPVAGVKPPIIPDDPPQVLTEDQERALLAACRGHDFAAIRDTAIVRLLIATPMRREELAGLRVEDVDRSRRVVTVLGKGRRHREMSFAPKAALALGKYLNVRHTHPQRHLEALWLTPKGALTGNGLYQMIRRRARQAGLEGVFVHLFRHSFAHHYLLAGGTEGDLSIQAGWSPSSPMPRRYGRSAATERAHSAYDRIRPGDNL